MEDIPPASRRVTRQEIRRMSWDQQRRFVRAVRKMMENPSGPGSSVFTRLASIHGYPGRIYCAHSRESFPAWHRAYLVAFERALQEADRDEGGDGDIALPYWDWAQITVRGEVYPRIVRDEFGDPPEGLLDPNDPDVRRRSSLQQLLAEGFSGMVDDDRSVRSWLGRLGGQVDAALRVPEHYLFASTDQPDGIEWPHNTVHTRLGFPMQSVPVASFHPIFWLHHCNVDRQFAKYEELMPRAEDSFRRNQATASGIGPGDTNPEDDRNWYTLPLDPFVFNGRPVSVSDTFDSRFNSYRYDSLPEDPIRRFGIRTRDLPTQLEFTLERSKISSHTYAFFVFVMPKDEADEWVPPEDVNAWDHHPSLANSFSFFGGMDPEDCEGCRQEATITRYVDITEALERLGLSRHDCGIRVMVTEGYSTVMRLEDVPDVSTPKIVGSLFESMAAPLAKGGEPTPQETGEVKGLQTFLKRYGWLKEEPDGVFGDETEAAVKRFQKFAGLEEDGVAGPTTKGKILHERMDGVSDQHDEDDEATYQKGQEVTYWVGPPPSYLDADAVHAEVRSAFAAWAEVTGVLFKEVCRKGQSKIVVIWGRQSPDNIFKFDGPGGALAHSTKDYIQFDNSERWLCQGQPAARGSYYIYPVVLHSVGHVLGLTSSSCGDDVMSPFYFPDRVELQQGDKERAAALYGA